MYEYLGACIILAIFWLVLYAYREDLRKPMIWSGIAYIIINLIAFFLIKIVSIFYYLPPIVPDYWDPQTLFNLGRLTGGLAIEDVLFMFFAGGMATALYEEIFRKRIKSSKKKDHHFFALFVSVIATLLFSVIVPLNPIYAIIIFGFAGAFTIWVQRKDLILHSIYGGLAFTFVYFILFLFFNILFPSFIQQHYNLSAISGILLIGVPLEEILYALSFGMLWSPFYEYEHGVKDK